MRAITVILILFISLAGISQDSQKKKLKQRTLGNKVTTKAIVLAFPTKAPGGEMGILVEIKKSPTYLKKFNAVIVK